MLTLSALDVVRKFFPFRTGADIMSLVALNCPFSSAVGIRVRMRPLLGTAFSFCEGLCRT
jgi:hypothetical protein